MRLFIVRHGKSIGNELGIVQGQLDFDLSTKGLEQARKVGLRLSKERFGAIYSSDLTRAVRTAKEITKYHQETPFHLTPELRERDFGSLSKKNGLEINWDSLPSDVESDEELDKRVKSFIDGLKEKHSRENVLLVAHGGINISLARLFLNKSLEELGHPGNTSVSILEINGDEVKPIIINSIDHLGDENGS